MYEVNEEYHMDRKEQLIEQAVKMFIERGYDNTSIDDITSACNITKGAYYHHFKNKDEIFMKAVAVIFEEVGEWIKKKIHSADNLRNLITAYFDFTDYFSFSKYYDNINSNTYLVQLEAIKKFPELRNDVAASFLRNIPYIKEKYNESCKKGEVKGDFDPDAFALHLTVLVEGLLFVSAVTGTESSLIENSRKMADNLWNMIRI